MHRTTKIATCCYCGTRAALVLGSDRHELVCSACGAPLRQLKSLPADTAARTPVSAPSRGQLHDRPKKKTKSKKKKRKSWIKDLVEDAFDELGDLFD
ncbi:hypothetical protein [Tropicimonas sediminicola]|uniref:TFIIB zinc-binding n=1 Tax=Tropicimonas sediminicola TaxID=1031541 RepID=A0A239GNN5_9RHOB|nr:hypothetical protein [Tropicimonas sediminicola]SNS70103.1 hypothetical protein SAMN05421757_1039 [Tropicimonas sediminicola]